jgi:hypothetical protein
MDRTALPWLNRTENANRSSSYAGPMRPSNGSGYLLVLAALVFAGCSSRSVGNTPTSKACDQACQDNVAARGLRETMKLGYNLTLQGNPVGAQDESTRCLSGSGRLYGNAESNADQGATQVALTYEFTACENPNVSAAQAENYDLIFDGSLLETGVLAVQPTANTAIIITADSLSISGTVYDPAIDYQVSNCRIALAQNGNDLSGSWCGRSVGLTL